jgi:hypothetical protein
MFCTSTANAEMVTYGEKEQDAAKCGAADQDVTKAKC